MIVICEMIYGLMVESSTNLYVLQRSQCLQDLHSSSELQQYKADLPPALGRQPESSLDPTSPPGCLKRLNIQLDCQDLVSTSEEDCQSDPDAQP